MSLNHRDLTNTILPIVTIDEYLPKTGNEQDIIVVTFASRDIEPINDLETFVQRSYIDIADVESSTVTDNDRNYLLFVEFERTPRFFKEFRELLRDVENVSGKLDWKVTTYLTDGEPIDYRTDQLESFVVVDPSKYVSKKEFQRKSVFESIESMVYDSSASYNIKDSMIQVFNQRYAVTAQLIDGGSYDDVVIRNALTESAFNFNTGSIEMKILNSILDNCNVNSIDDYTMISNNSGQVVLLSDLTLSKY